jgi:hypothetical protein
MEKIAKILVNLLLLVVLMALMVFPLSSMGILKIEPQGDVLSTQTTKTVGGDTDKKAKEIEIIRENPAYIGPAIITSFTQPTTR